MKKNCFNYSKKTNNLKNNDNNNSNLTTKIIVKFDFIKKESNLNMSLFDLKCYINTKLHMQEYEYELFIEEIPLNNFPNDTLIANILNKYNVNKIVIKAFKTIFDVQNILNNYEKYLINKISSKEDEIKMFKAEGEKIKEDLKSFQLI